jgi:hypothetical protein
MFWKLAHRPRGAAPSTVIESSAATSRDAITQLRSEISDNHVILYISQIHDVEEMPAL